MPPTAPGTDWPDPLILFPRAAGQHAFAVNTQVLRDAGIDVHVAQECSHWHTIIALVASGLGVTIAPDSVTGLLPPGVCKLELDGPAPSSRIYLATRQGDDRPLVRAFVETPVSTKERRPGPSPALPIGLGHSPGAADEDRDGVVDEL